ncbi:MAG: N-acetylmuramoyl-L-alanine amidase [Dehalococcoidia bacterium]|nr:N-acetylmuramoyl-L-alanine amidase [Dehalococcoidia bacterium]
MTTTDLTNRYYLDSYMEGGLARWALDRGRRPVRAVILHHTGGWYGRPLDASTTVEEEIAQVDALARDHRARFGIGPGYHYLAFPSGRAYAVGKWGTQRAHTTGRDPATGERWNVQAVGVCAFGNFEAERPAPGTVAAVRAVLAEMNRIAGRVLPVIPHGETPSTDASGRGLAQATACPGTHLRSALARPDGGASNVDVEAVRREVLAAQERLAEAVALLAALRAPSRL